MNKNKIARWAATTGVSFADAPPKIDREAGIIRDVVLAQVGEAKGHDVHLEQEFIDDLVAQAQEQYAEIGLKARFGHPAMSTETMGTQLGAYYNFRKRGEQAIADLHLLDAAAHSPKGNLREWTLQMAEERPDFIMNSIVFKRGEDYIYDENGEKLYESEWPVPKFEKEEYPPKDVKRYRTLKTLLFSDLVEQGAATDSLFSAQFNKDKFAVQAHEFLNERADLDQFIRENPEKLVNFLHERGISLQKTTWFDKLADLLNIQSSSKLNSLSANVEALQAEIETLTAERDAANAALNDLQQEFDSQRDALQVAQSRIEELEAMPVTVTAAAFPKKTTQPEPLTAWESIDKEMAARRAALQRLGRK